MLKNKIIIFFIFLTYVLSAQKLDSVSLILVDTISNGKNYQTHPTDTVWHQEILYLVNKKGVETGETKLGRKLFPCQGYLHFHKISFLTRYMTTYESCTGKWYSIDYYFLGIKTKTRRNPIFKDRDYKAHKAVILRSRKKLVLSVN